MFALKSCLRLPHTLILFLFAAVFAHGFTGSGTEGDPYLINNSTDWNDFAAAVNGGKDFHDEFVALGDNITASTTVSDAESHPFAGTFDGCGNTITASINPDGSKQGTSLFRYISGATIRNLTVDGSVTGYVGDNSYAAGLVGFAWAGTNTIENVTVAADVTGGKYAGGIVGHGKTSSLTLRNCVYSGTISNVLEYAGGLLGWSDGSTLTIENCLFKGSYIGSYTGSGYYFHPVAVKAANASMTTTVSQCYYLLKPARISDDNIAATGTYVYITPESNSLSRKNTAADGLTYYTYPNANTVSVNDVYEVRTEAITPAPTSVVYDNNALTAGTDYTVKYRVQGSNGDLTSISSSGDYIMVITGEGNYAGTLTSPVFHVIDGSEQDPYLIASEEDWNSFVQRVNNGETFKDKFLNLKDDINVSTMVGKDSTSHYFAGTFDGSGHTITVSYKTTNKIAAPFRFVNGATIKNLHTAGSITTSDKFAAGIAAHVKNGFTLANSHSSVSIWSSWPGDGTHGGLIALAATGEISVTNSYFSGSLLGTQTHSGGGFIGWVETNNATATITNGLFNPAEITLQSAGSYTFYRARDFSKVIYSNCYYTKALGTAQGTRVYAAQETSPFLKKMETAVADGNTYYTEVSATISGVNPDYNKGTLVSAITPSVTVSDQALVQGTDFTVSISKGEKVFSNVLDEDGEYTLTILGTGNYSGSVSTKFWVIHNLDGEGTSELPYIIANEDDWNSFAQKVSTGTTYGGKFVKLTNNINVTTMAGKTDGDNRFHGTFDGDDHTITVAYGTAQNPVGDYAAPFRVATSATIKNLHTSGNIFANGKFAGGILGRTTGTVKITNCSSNVSITRTTSGDGSIGGLVGNVSSGSLAISNSYFNGSLLGNDATNFGGLVGWVNSESSTISVDNCLFNPQSVSSSILTSGRTFVRWKDGATVTLNKCYYTGNFVFTTSQGGLVSSSIPQSAIYNASPVTAADGKDYYLVASISWLQDTYVITDNLEISPVLTVNGTPLIKGADYTVTFNAPVNGEYPITVEGIGDYQGSYSITAKFIGKFQGEGTEDSPYIIASILDWESVVELVAQGNTFSGKFLKMTEDISSVTTMIGSDSTAHYFAGTFDGNGHTLNDTLGTINNPLQENNVGPFRYIDGATIKGLRVIGEVRVKAENYKGTHASGLVGYAKGNSLITNNRISTTIVGRSFDDYVSGEHAGLVGAVGANASLTIKDCLFDGELLKHGSNSINNNAGFIGKVSGNATQVTIENCLFNPKKVTLDSDYSSTFARGPATIINSYYKSTVFGTDQGIDGRDIDVYSLETLLGYAWEDDYDIGSVPIAVPSSKKYETRYGAITVFEDNSNGNKTAKINGDFREKEEAVIDHDIQVNSVTFNRTFNVRSDDTPVYSTIMLPFSIKAGEVGGATFYQLSGFNKVDGKWKEAVVTPIGNNVELTANTPYLLEASESTISFNNQSPLTLNTTTGTKSVSFGNWEFRGTYSYIEYADTPDLIGRAYGFAGRNQDKFKVGEFVKVGSGAWTSAMRAYLVYNEGNSSPKSAAGLSTMPFDLPETMDVVIVDSEGKSIGGGTLNTVTGEIRMDRWYDLQGRRLNGKPNTKGTYYHNGKRVIIK